MLSPGEIAARAFRVVALVLCIAAVWYLGVAISKLRGKKPDNVIWYDGSVLGVGFLGVPFGVTAIAARLGGLEGWNSDIAWWLAALCFSVTLLMALIVFRYRIVVLDDMLVEARVFRPGERRVEWAAIKGWRPGSRLGSLILELKPSGKFEFVPAFTEGSEALIDALIARSIPEI